MTESRTMTTTSSSIARDNSMETQSNHLPPDRATKAQISLATRPDQRLFKSLPFRKKLGRRETTPPSRSQMFLETTLITKHQLSTLREHRMSAETRRTGRVTSSRVQRMSKAKDKDSDKLEPVEMDSSVTLRRRMLMLERPTLLLPSALRRAPELQSLMIKLITKERTENSMVTLLTNQLLGRTTDSSSQLR